jgi:hypothetical protein
MAWDDYISPGTTQVNDGTFVHAMIAVLNERLLGMGYGHHVHNGATLDVHAGYTTMDDWGGSSNIYNPNRVDLYWRVLHFNTWWCGTRYLRHLDDSGDPIDLTQEIRAETWRWRWSGVAVVEGVWPWPGGLTRKYRRTIRSLSDPGEEGQRARLWISDLFSPDRRYAGGIFVRSAGVWLADDAGGPADFVETTGSRQDGDFLGIWVANDVIAMLKSCQVLLLPVYGLGGILRAKVLLTAGRKRSGISNFGPIEDSKTIASASYESSFNYELDSGGGPQVVRLARAYTTITSNAAGETQCSVYRQRAGWFYQLQNSGGFSRRVQVFAITIADYGGAFRSYGDDLVPGVPVDGTGLLVRIYDAISTSTLVEAPPRADLDDSLYLGNTEAGQPPWVAEGPIPSSVKEGWIMGGFRNFGPNSYSHPYTDYVMCIVDYAVPGGFQYL